MDAITCDAIDRLVALEIRYGGGLPRGVIQPLYQAARAHHGQPLTFLAADALRRRVDRGRRVFVVTGAGTPPWLPNGETDGPPGAASIARALEIGLGAKPILLAEERNLAPVIAAAQGAGLAIVDATLFAQRTGCAMAIALPLGPEAGRDAAERLFAEHDPAAIVFVEKAGPNANGLFHSILGTSRTPDQMANAHLLAERAKKEGRLTIGIGDGGNEIGFGNIVEAVRDIQPFGRVSKTPEGGGIATIAETDVLVVGGVSNWAAYGVAAALAALLRRPDVLHDVETERRILERCVDAGAMDGAITRQVPMVDGTSAAVQFSMITLLREIVEVSLLNVERGVLMTDVGVQIAAENIDRVVTVEIRRPGVVRGFKDVLYQVARGASDGPLCLRAAEMLNRPPCRVTIVTGAAVPEHMPVGENDGPFGSTVLAATLERLGHTVGIATDPACARPIAALLRRAGTRAEVTALRMDDAAQQEELAEAADILVAVERLGGNPNRHLYGMTANTRDAFRCNVDMLFTTHTRLGRTSLAIGDGGNEIGFGAIRAALARRLPQINQADKTPCGGGVFSVVPTTRLVVATTSNLGAYAVCAALGLVRHDPGLCHSPEEELALHHVGVGLGLADGGGGGVIAACDGIPAEANAAIVLLMRTIVERALLPPRARAF